MGMAAFGCLWLRWQRIFPAKWTLCAALIVVLCGNVASGFAPSVGVVILGRIIAGIGAVAIPPATSALGAIYSQGGGGDTGNGTGSSMTTSTILIVAWVAASLAAPVIAGVLCEYATWRWTFILKTILAAVAAGLVLFVPSVDPPDYYVRQINEDLYANGRPRDAPPVTVPKGELALATGDWVIAASIFGMEACVVLCFWDWDSNFGLCMAAVMLVPLFWPWVTWGLVAWLNKPSYRVQSRKRVCLATTITFVLSAVPISIAYSASLRLQVSEPSPFKAGVGLLALAGGQELASVMSTFITNRVRWHRPLASLGSVCLCGAAVGLFTTKPYMFATYPLIALVGIGTGLAERYPVLVLQSDLHSDPEALRTAMSILSFWSNAGRILGITATGFPPINDFLIDKGAPSYTGNTVPLFPGVFVDQKPQLLQTLANGYLVAIVFAAIAALCVLPAALWLRNLVSDEDWQIHQDQRRRGNEAKREARRLRKAERQARKKHWPKGVPDAPKAADKAKEAAMDKEADRDVEKCDTDSVTTIVEGYPAPAPPPQYTTATIPPKYDEAVSVD